MVSFGGQRKQRAGGRLHGRKRADPGPTRRWIARYQLDVIDFDVEGAAIGDSASIQRRGAGKSPRSKRAPKPTATPWSSGSPFPVARDGMDGATQQAIKDTLAAGVDLAGVNVMTMDFGNSAQPERDMSAATEGALQASHDQLVSIYHPGQAGPDLQERMGQARRDGDDRPERRLRRGLRRERRRGS